MLTKLSDMAKAVLTITALLSGVLAAVTLVFGFVATVLYSFYYTAIWDNVRANLGLVDDHVLEFQDLSCYVKEPTRINDTVVLSCVVRRSEQGKACQFLSAQYSFTDTSGIAVSGGLLSRPQNWDEFYSERKLELKPDAALADGRVRLSISALYDCNGTQTVDRFPTVVYKQGD